MSRRITIFDTTLRDGEQSPGAAMSVEQKVKMAATLERLGVDRIEAGFPVSSPVQFEAVSRIAGVLDQATTVALARCVRQDIHAAADALKKARFPMLHLFLATSPLHRKFKLKMTKEEILHEVDAQIRYAAKLFPKIEFSAEDASRTEPLFLFDVVKTAIEAGASCINIPDTVGYAMPVEFGALIESIIQSVPGIDTVDLSVHCHNDLGLAVANSISAVCAGASQVEVTLNGIGERAGNCSLEEFVMSLHVRQDILDFHTGVKTSLLYPSSKLLQNITGMPTPRNKPIFGDNAFSHESGIHQDGVIKNRETYEIMKPQDIGRSPETLVMGRHSGKHGLREKLELYGIELTDEQFSHVFEQFTIIADKKKEVFDEDIFNIVSSILGKFSKGYELGYFQAITGDTQIPTATVKVCKGEDEFISSATGDGPVDAVFKAIDQSLGMKPRLEEYVIQAIGTGKDAQGQVKLILEINGRQYPGRGASTDIIEASALAYINALNQYCFRGEQSKWEPFFMFGGEWPSEEVI